MYDWINTILSQLSRLTSALNPRGGFDANIQDQTTRPLFIPLSSPTGVVTTFSVQPTRGDQVISVTSTVGWVIGSRFEIISGDLSEAFFFGTVTAVGAGQLTIDSPLDYDFPLATATIVQIITNMAIDGSVTPRVFSARGSDIFRYDITRIIITILTDNAVDLNGFGDAATPLVNGIILRREDGIWQNYWNVKTNMEFANIAYDFTRYAKSSPQDVAGLAVRLTFAGQEKIGVVVRLDGVDDQLEIIVQDNLLLAGPYGIVRMTAMAEGHIVD